MLKNSSRLLLPFIQPAQAQKHATHNEALRLLDILVQMTVVSGVQIPQPSNAAETSCYLIPQNLVMEWSGRDNQIALYENGDWQYFTPVTGWRVYIASSTTLKAFDGVTWRPLSSSDTKDVIFKRHPDVSNTKISLIYSNRTLGCTAKGRGRKWRHCKNPQQRYP